MKLTAKARLDLQNFFLRYLKKNCQSISEHCDGGQSPRAIENELKAYFQSRQPKKNSFRPPLKNSFEANVLRVCATIPYGELRSYSWIARQIKSPRAARAVGQALSKNNLPILIPCHRVISKNGSLGGYRWGVERKKALIEWEANHVA
jgi:O-6-methylguanine DNA methyltransferase